MYWRLLKVKEGSWWLLVVFGCLVMVFWLLMVECVLLSEKYTCFVFLMICQHWQSSGNNSWTQSSNSSGDIKWEPKHPSLWNYWVAWCFNQRLVAMRTLSPQCSRIPGHLPSEEIQGCWECGTVQLHFFNNHQQSKRHQPSTKHIKANRKTAESIMASQIMNNQLKTVKQISGSEHNHENDISKHQ